MGHIKSEQVVLSGLCKSYTHLPNFKNSYCDLQNKKKTSRILHLTTLQFFFLFFLFNFFFFSRLYVNIPLGLRLLKYYSKMMQTFFSPGAQPRHDLTVGTIVVLAHKAHTHSPRNLHSSQHRVTGFYIWKRWTENMVFKYSGRTEGWDFERCSRHQAPRSHGSPQEPERSLP